MIDKEILRNIKKYIIKDSKENEKTNPNLDLQSALLLMELMELMEKLPNKCKVYNLKQFIFNVELHLQHYERFKKCIDCDGVIE